MFYAIFGRNHITPLMGDLLQDPVFFWLMWAMFTVAGTIIGWTLRANTAEKEVRNVLGRIEQEKNTLARLYTHVKHQHDLREADFRRVSLELNNLQVQVQWLENERVNLMPDTQAANLKIEKAEAHATQLAQKVLALDALAEGLRKKNQELSNQLELARQELEAWEVLYRDFKAMQMRLVEFEKNSKSLEVERTNLQAQLAAAQAETDAVQKELLRVTTLLQRQHSIKNAAKRGSRAAPEHTDDLKVITGITPIAEQKLMSLGIHSFEQISSWDDDAVIAFARALGISPGKVFQEDWVGQARYLIGEK